MGEEKRRGPRYTPLSKRQDRPASILWLVKFHPELRMQISKLIGNNQTNNSGNPRTDALEHRYHAD